MKCLVEQVQPGLWQISFHLLPQWLWLLSTNCWLWQEPGADELTLIDTGYPENAPELINQIGLKGLPLKRIILTHAHPDHAGAAQDVSVAFAAPVYVHPGDIPFVQAPAPRNMADEEGSSICKFILRHTPAQYTPLPIVNVRPLEVGVPTGGLIPYHTPGHTPGSITLWSERLKAVICGDNLDTTWRRPCLGTPGFSLNAAERNDSIRKILRLPIRFVLAGHGPRYELKEDRDLFMRLLRRQLGVKVNEDREIADLDQPAGKK